MSVAVQQHRLTIIDKLTFLLEPSRYKILKGGRGSVKSWTIARALQFLGTQKPLRILCTREVQKSIKDSVHVLLRDQLTLLGLEDFYQPFEQEIRGKNGTTFIFSGLSDQTATSIKSFEGVDIVWVEEAQTVSEQSWKILIPTIRKAGSEIWISFNPELDTDPTYVRFVERTPPNSTLVHLTYRDNPWFTSELEAERAHDEATLSKEEYEYIWEGKCRSSATGAIYSQEVAAMVAERRFANLPYDPRLKVHVVVDLGWNDLFAVGLWQRGLADVRGIKYKEYQYKRVDEVAADLKNMSLNWGAVWMPWDGWITARQTGKSDAQVFQSFGFTVQPIKSPTDAENVRIRMLRQLFPRIYLDQTHCAELLEHLKRYKRAIPKHGEPSHPVHDQHSHAADMAGYMAQVVELMTNDSGPKPTFWDAVKAPQPSSTMGAFGA